MQRHIWNTAFQLEETGQIQDPEVATTSRQQYPVAQTVELQYRDKFLIRWRFARLETDRRWFQFHTESAGENKATEGATHPPAISTVTTTDIIVP